MVEVIGVAINWFAVGALCGTLLATRRWNSLRLFTLAVLTIGGVFAIIGAEKQIDIRVSKGQIEILKSLRPQKL